jgi:membrane protein YdbS with pleckstrin-like domain
VIVTFVGAARARVSWVRGSALTIHVLLFAAGTGCLQLAIGPWWFGFGLVAVALLGFLAAVLARPELPQAGDDSVVAG